MYKCRFAGFFPQIVRINHAYSHEKYDFVIDSMCDFIVAF
jgi:hypothetical protein